MQISTSPDIVVLDFAALFDISKAVPEIKLTNGSSGPDLASCKWWYEVITPSGTFIHKGLSTALDMNGVWATETIAEPWPQPFGQVEWSNSVPYQVTLYVQDGANAVFSLTKEIFICRPNGNTTKSIGNFGVASALISVQCNKARLKAEDQTNYVYNGAVGTIISRKYTLSYPGDEDGVIPSPFVVNSQPNVFLPIAYSGEGYQVYFDAVQAYTTDGMTVRVKYKFRKTFNVFCNVDLCPLICDITNMYDSLAGKTCTAEMKDKLLMINAKMHVLQIAMMQPLCGIDVPALIEEIKAIGGFTCNCVGLPSTGINGSLDDSSNLAINFDTCGDITASATVVGNNINMVINGKAVSVIMDPDIDTNGAFIITETIDNEACTKVYTLKVDMAVLAAQSGGCCPVSLPIKLHGTTDTPVGCPASFYSTPFAVYEPSDNTIIGTANNPTDLISILNSNADWLALGTATNMGNCIVGFIFKAGVVNPPDYVFVRPATTTVDPNDPLPGDYQVNIMDYCIKGTPLTPAQVLMPSTMWVKFLPGDPYFELRAVLSYTDLLAKLNAHPNKPAYVTFAPVPANISSVTVQILNNTVNNTLIEILHDFMPYAVIGDNNHQLAGLNGEAVNYMNINNNTQMGSVCGASGGSGRPWQIIRSGDALYFVDSFGGMLHKIDITSPLTPFQALTVQLPTFGGTAFTGLPLYKGSPSYWDTFIVQDDNFSDYFYIHESSSGAVYKYDRTTDTVVASFKDNKLIGKQPRLISNSKLYFTHYGDFETGLGVSSGVARNSLVYIDLGVAFAAPAINIVSLAALGDTVEPWAMTRFNVNGSYYLVMKSGNVHIYDTATDTVPTSFGLVFAVAAGFINFCNATIFGGQLYVACNGKGSFYAPINMVNGALTAASGLAFDPLIGGTGVANNNHLNIQEVDGKCYLLVTYWGENPSGIARFSRFGDYIDITQPGIDGFYNVILKYMTQFYPANLC